ncbi:hypothetical protein J437_LFUL016660 [Ladona fulva]|uniref:EGF-like domain-containing protein n=1 Tax=Ladona fulva TaxID=123851 RepID=A0A8K0KKP7_LADFU|nr:hypothetical protein J437_LFUL016660 [Ladona fulva]
MSSFGQYFESADHIKDLRSEGRSRTRAFSVYFTFSVWRESAAILRDKQSVHPNGDVDVGDALDGSGGHGVFSSTDDTFPGEPCPAGLCGDGAECDLRGGKAFCKCPNGFLGNPLHRCRPECDTDSDCRNDEFCNVHRCRKVCSVDACAAGAMCDAVRHRPVCTCPPGFLGSPEVRCYAECEDSSHCPSTRACINSKCADPCVGVCGINAECEVRNHSPVCKCPKGMTGHPFDRCRPITEGDVCRDSKCGLNADCSAIRDRQGYLQALCTCPRGYFGNPLNECRRGEFHCMNPCYDSACGANAKCEVRNHRVYCSCPYGFTGNALVRCHPN